MWRMIRKNKKLLFGLCLQLAFFSLFSIAAAAQGGEPSKDGFVIEADRVVGSGMSANIIRQETSTSNAKPMLRIQYKKATIYGMKLTKQIETSQGPVSITLKASGPVTVTGMTVDTTAISFQGACLQANTPVPEVGMDKIVMVAHYMNADDSVIEKLALNTVAGRAGTAKPGTLKIIEQLSQLPLNQLDSEIEKISKGHMPLTCDQVSDTNSGASNSGLPLGETVGKVTDPVKELTPQLDPILKPINPITKSLDPVLKQLDPVTKRLETVTKPLEQALKPLEPVTKPLESVTKPLKPALKQLEPVTKPIQPALKQLEPVTKSIQPALKPLDQATKPVETAIQQGTAAAAQVSQTVCEKASAAGGVLTKELALNLIDSAIQQKVPLSDVCKNDQMLSGEFKNWQNSLLGSLGLLNLLGQPLIQDPMDQLTKMRTAIANEQDGAIVLDPAK